MTDTNTINIPQDIPEKAFSQLVERSKLPTNDVVFHCLFGTKGNENITKNFIEQILGKTIETIDLDLNLNLIREYYDDKLEILDVRIKDSNGTNYNIEMQNVSSEKLPERLISYWAKLYNGELASGDDYNRLNKTIVILIVNDRMSNLKKIKKYHTKWNIREEEYTDIILTDYFEIHIIELPKYIKNRTEENKKMWLDFLLQPQGKEVFEAMETSVELKEAKVKWDRITRDRKLRDRALRREIAILDYNTGMRDATEKGKAIGMSEGKAIGMSEGKTIGRNEMQTEIVKKMYKEKFDIKLICKVTGMKEIDIKNIVKSSDE